MVFLIVILLPGWLQPTNGHLFTSDTQQVWPHHIVYFPVDSIDWEK